MPIEFLGIAATNDGSETTPRSGAELRQGVHRSGWAGRTRTSAGTGCSSPTAPARPSPPPPPRTCSPAPRRLQILLAHRPNVSYPTFAAKTFATLDQIGDGRLTVHFITGGTDHEQQREGDYLTKDQRYSRTREYMQIVKKAWTSHEPFDWDGEHYRFADFVSDTFPVQQPRPDVSFGGSSRRRVRRRRRGGRHLRAVGRAARRDRRADRAGARGRPGGRPDDDAPHPGGLPADHRADRGAGLGEGVPHRRPDRGSAPPAGCSPISRRHPLTEPENTGSQRLLEIAERGERFDRALWTPTAAGHRRRGQLQRPGRDAGDRRRRPCWTTSTWASTSSRCAATTCSATRSTSAGT